MKIACIIESLKTFGGTQIQCIRVAEHLVKQGHQVQIITTAFDPQFTRKVEDTVKVATVEPASENRMQDFARKVSGLIHGSDWLFLFDWDVYRLKHYLPKYKVCWFCNDPPYSKRFSNKSGIGAWIMYEFEKAYGIRKERQYVKELDHILVLNDKSRDFLHQHYDVESKVVRCGIDANLEESVAPEQLIFAELSARYHLEKKNYVLAIGIAYRHRNFEVLIRAMRQIQDNLRVLIVSSGYYDSTYVAELKSLISQDNRIQIEDRFITEAEKNTLLGNALCFVFPNKNQTWGLAPLESLIHKTIPIISRECGVTEVLLDNNHALHFDPNNPTELAGKIRFVIDNPAACEKIVQGGRSYVLEHLTWDNYARNILRAIEERDSARH